MRDLADINMSCNVRVGLEVGLDERNEAESNFAPRMCVVFMQAAQKTKEANLIPHGM